MVSKNTKTEPASKSVTKSVPAKQTGAATPPPVVATETEKKTKKVAAKKEPEPVKAVEEPVKEVKQTGAGKKNKSTKEVVAEPKEVKGKEVKGKEAKEVKVVEGKAEVKKAAKKTAEKKVNKSKAKVEVKQETEDAEEAGEGDEANSKLRYFKLIYNNQIQGRYCGKKPKQAANKAFSSIIKDCKKSGQQNGGVNVDINFTIKECTRNSKHKEYKYIGKREVLVNPVKVEIANSDGSIKQIEYKYHNKLQKARKTA
jgi:hypothetical protein